MFEKTFSLMEAALEAMAKEAKSLFGDRAVSSISCNGMTVVICGSDVSIKGELRELRINGKLVRFAVKP